MYRNKRVDQEPDPPKRQSSKNTRDWCKGHEGVKHQYSWKEDAKWSNHRWSIKSRNKYMVFSCDVCGKEKSHCFGWLGECKCGHHL